MQTLAYSILHFLVDGMCAFAMFSTFRNSEKWYLYILIYNFCAFALQVLFGAVMDILRGKKEEGKLPKTDLTVSCILSGIFLTVLGAFTHPSLLGIGNALFHVGGGVGTIDADRIKKKKGVLLGIFVAPGALGLFLGTCLGKTASGSAVLGYELMICAAFVLAILLLALSETPQEEELKKGAERENGVPEKKRELSAPLTFGAVTAAVLCFIVVMIRSYIGLSVVFEWKTGFFAGLICTLAVVLGKMAGGLFSARFGIGKVMAGSLLLSAVFYFFSDIPLPGVLALFFFNMTMPVTLYLITERFDSYPGFTFGLLTMALFLGFIPGYIGKTFPAEDRFEGLIGSLLSLLLLLLSLYLLRRKGKKEAF